MKIALAILLVILTLLAVFSGITKIALMPQDVEFFGRYGFSNLMLIVFGVAQLIGGVLLPFKRTRFWGAAIVAITFFISLVVLVMDGNTPVSVVTAIATLLLLMVMKLSWRSGG
ncbi:MAG: DoxX family protein [Woeseiaceae bacterium]